MKKYILFCLILVITLPLVSAFSFEDFFWNLNVQRDLIFPHSIGSDSNILWFPTKTYSCYDILLDGPHYTRPRNFSDMEVPDVLLSGDHKKIANWFLNKREEKTKILRKDLWKKYRSVKKNGV